VAWTASAIFREWLITAYQAAGTGFTGLDSDTINVALFNNSITPDKDAAVASTGYNTGAWASGANEVSDTNWPAGGRPLAGKTFTAPSTGVFMFDAIDLAGAGNVTLTNAFGCLVYDNTISGGTVAKQGVSFHWFNGAQSVTAGTFTILWHANGVNRITI
jgi:hypothetical protein